MGTGGSLVKGITKDKKLISIVLALLTFLFFLYYFSGFAYAVVVDGETIGYVKQEEEAHEAIAEAAEYIKSTYGLDASVANQVEYMRARPPKGRVLDKDQIKAAFLNSLDFKVSAASIYIDGKKIAILKDRTIAEKILNDIKSKLSGGSENASFKEKVEIKDENVSLGEVTDEEKALDMLLKSDQMTTYTVKKGDTLWDIASANGTSADKLMALNPNIKEKAMQPGDTIVLDKPKPLVTVVTKEVAEYEMPIPFEIENIQDNTLPIRVTRVKQQGVEGSKQVKAEIIKENGVEVARNILEEKVISQPVKRVVRIGTNRTLASGVFSYPVAGVLTSRFGQRWGREHTGVDLAVPIGTEVRASDGGKVIFTGRSGGYGILVKIDHGNGYVTYYGHLSKILVDKGDRVAKGDVIALSGNTGNTTGPHLHFEVRKNGVPQNPLNYLNK
ncbi:MAG: peptidoglycan DD-metalloendopeptidase family protein [Thermoanaerobacteraceae bacterium]|nr:peptidoglycan DD-metalloendopeptidase family protein [Thermoanaerobacteraceae bacterium]